MDPVSLGLQIVGMGFQLFGGFEAASKAREASQINQGIAQDEQGINAQKKQAMELQARRQQLEQVRNMQRLRAQATAAAVNQGASTGSGLAGGLSQITDQGTFNLQGISQNLEIGSNIFGYNNDISSKKMQLAQVQGDAATDQALSSLGGSLVKIGPTVGGLYKDASAGFGRMDLGSGFMGGGSPSGYGRG